MFSALSACAEQPSAHSGGPSPGAIGLAHIQLMVDPDALTSDVMYEITGNGILRVKGVMEAIPGTSAIGVVVNLPQGTGYTIRVHTNVAMPGRDEEVCSASSMFDVSSSRATELGLTLQCDDSVDPVDGGRVKDGGSTAADGGRVTVVATPGNERPAADAGLVAPSHPDSGNRPGTSVTAPSDAATETCDACSQRLCSEVRTIERDRDCYQTNGQVVHGPAMGAYRSEVCVALMKCAHRSGCAADNPEECYCGHGISSDSCVKHGPVGICRGEYEAAGESWEPADLLGDKLMSRYTVLNAALPLLSCEAARCTEPCFPSAQ
jgi:hypothetical protein